MLHQLRYELDALLLTLFKEALSLSKYGMEADVWSFGIMMIELFSHKHPLSYIQWGHELIRMAISKNIVVELPDETKCAKEIISLLQACTQLEPEGRPSFHEIAAKLSSAQKQFQFVKQTV